MKKLIPFALLLLFFLALHQAGYCKDNDRWIAAQKKLYVLKDRGSIDHMLKKIHTCFPVFYERIKALALLRIGTPYSGGCLGEEKPPDTGPLFRIDVADCTVFVITTVALAHKDTYNGAREMMKVLNYYNPPIMGKVVVSYENRIHFTSERLHKCPYFQDITRELTGEDKLKSVTLVLNRKSDGGRLLNIPWEKEVEMFYVPFSAIDASFCKKLPPACGVAFVREKNFSLGIVISHEGVIIDRTWVIEADSVLGKVKKTAFLSYIKQNADYFDGVIISRFL